MVLSPTLGDITQLHNQHNMSEEKCVNLAVGGPTPLIVVNFTWFIRLRLQMQALSVFVLHMTAPFLPFPSKHNLKSSLVAWTRHFQQTELDIETMISMLLTTATALDDSSSSGDMEEK